MSDVTCKKIYEEQKLTSEAEVKEYLRKISNEEQVYSIALFDILGFSNYVENHGNQAILELYEKLLDLVHKQESISSENTNFAGSVVPVRISEDWKQIRYAADANGFINVCHFSDTFLIYVNYHLRKSGFWWLTQRKSHILYYWEKSELFIIQLCMINIQFICLFYRHVWNFFVKLLLRVFHCEGVLVLD